METLKPRFESEELRILRSLNNRTELSSSEKQNYFNLKKGYEGEVRFDLLTASLQSKILVLNDLRLESKNTSFQIDSLFITQSAIIPYEIKNFEGNYYYEEKNFYLFHSKQPITNPLHQLNRIQTMLSPLLQTHGYHFHIEGNVVFINPEFFLYQAPLNEPIVYPTQLNLLLKSIDAKPAQLNGKHRNLADQLLSLHKPENPYSKLPAYSFGSVRKGLSCIKCDSFSITIGGNKVICNKCGSIESVDAAVVRSVDEIKLLFSEMKITTNIVMDWCQGIFSQKVIRKILKDNYKAIGKVKYSYYE